ncbi:MAG: nucleotidyltransferase domain-containing protein, partial [Pseudomonadales bacterium]
MVSRTNSDPIKASNTSVTPLINIEEGAAFELSYNTFITQLAKTQNAIECKVLLQDYQEQMDEAFRAGVDPYLLIQARSKLIDILLRYLWAQEDWDEQKIALIAVGGYGRGELHPRSDIDLLFVLDKAVSKSNGETIGRMVTYLWDCGLDLGHSVRTLDECLDYAKEDITVMTNMLESRPVAGEESLFTRLKLLTDTEHMWPSSEFFMGKWKEQRNRHRDTNSNEYNLEPNIKTSPGGLRDIQNIIWIAQRHLGEGNISRLEKSGFLTEVEAVNLVEGINFLWKVRYALHMLSQRHEDRLLFEYQIKVASLFGYADDDANLAVEKFMHEYYRRVLLLAELNDVLIQHFDQDRVLTDDKEELISLNERFCVRNGYIDVVDEQVFVDHLWALIEIFVLMAEHNYIRGVRASTMRLMRTHRERIDDQFRNDPKVIDLFMQLVKSNRNVPLQFKRMRKHGILSKYLPAFGEIIGKMQYDLF